MRTVLLVMRAHGHTPACHLTDVRSMICSRDLFWSGFHSASPQAECELEGPAQGQSASAACDQFIVLLSEAFSVTCIFQPADVSLPSFTHGGLSG